MKNNFIKILLFFLFTNVSFADELEISAKNISLDKKKEISIFRAPGCFWELLGVSGSV